MRNTSEIIKDLQERPEFKTWVWDDKTGWETDLYPHIKETIAKLKDLDNKYTDSLWKDG